MLMTFVHSIYLPSDITVVVLDYLSQTDLKSIRLVCHEFSSLARSLLFKSITISTQLSDICRFLNIVRDQELCKLVQCLKWQEVAFEAPGSESPRGALFHPPHEALLDYFAPNAVCQDDRTWREREQDFQIAFKASCKEVEPVIASMDTCLAALVEGFGLMSNLKTVVSRDTKERGSASDAFMGPGDPLRHALPLIDAAMRLLKFPKDITRSLEVPQDKGFFCVLRALAITGATVENLVTERATGLLKCGIQTTTPFSAVEFGNQFAQAFKHLRRLVLCLHWPEPNLGQGLSMCLLAADLLEHLEISVTSDNLLLPTKKVEIFSISLQYRRLHTLVLERVEFSADEIVRFIQRQASSLVSVAMWECCLDGHGSWETVLQKLHERVDLHLQSFILKSPRDAEIIRRLDDREIAPRIKSEEVLRFINEGGRNPYACRKWIYLPADDYDDLLSHASDYSNISDYGRSSRYGSDDSGDTNDRDLDGPEYDSDYDFDAEPLSESGEESVLDESLSAEDHFYNERWNALEAK